ncbi:MAG: Abi family protein [Bacilli bacterium]|nr:Abi family protein [Bacilli bacterium]
MEKIFKTLEEQIEILRNKNLIIDDEEYVKNILLRENYFFINGYRFLFIKSLHNRTFIEGTNFRELYALFNFDRQLRNILFKNILILENNIKSIISYELSRKYGFKEKRYLNPNNFTKDPKRTRQVNDLLKKIKRQMIVNGGQHTATKHYQMNYGYTPLWIVVKVLSFGIVGELYTILKSDDQKNIADIFNVEVESLLVYLPIIANYRNLCAHEDICYEHKTQKEIPLTKYHEQLNIPKMNGEYIYGINDLFALIIILKRLLSKDDFHSMLSEISYELSYLEGRLQSINVDKVLDRMGFPKNYKEIVRMD